MPGLSPIKHFEPIALTLLFFGIYTTERMRLSFSGISVRYSLIALMIYCVWDTALRLRCREAVLSAMGLSDPLLTSFIPFLIFAAVSVSISSEANTAVLVWAYNAVVLTVSARLAANLDWLRLRLPWLVAMLAHAGIVFWDQLCLSGYIPQDLLIGGLYATYSTFRVKGFYVAPQFYSVGLGLSATLWLFLQIRSKSSMKLNALLAVVLVLTSSILTMSRTGILMLVTIMVLVILAALSRRLALRTCATVAGVTTGSLAFAGTVILLLTPSQASQVSELFNIGQTWARVCPLVVERIAVVDHCPPSQIPAPEGDVQLTSEGRRLAEWSQLADDLRTRPVWGFGYAGALEQMTYKPMLEEIQQKRVQYRFESVWATVGTYYGFMGLISLLFALLLIGQRLRWHWSLAAPLSFWLVGAHSSQVFARLDIWLPLFVYANCLISSSPALDGKEC